MKRLKIIGGILKSIQGSSGSHDAWKRARRKPLKITMITAAATAVLFALVLTYDPLMAAVGATKHNLSITAPTTNAIMVTTRQNKEIPTSEICVFCHTPHFSTPATALWNKSLPGGPYNLYASSTLAATMAPNALVLSQPTGASKLCLSCHDGTIALGQMLNLPGRINAAAVIGGTIDVTGVGVTANKLTNVSSSYIGTELGDDHPISFAYSRSYPSNVEIKASPFTPNTVKLDKNSELQCTSCHDPHGTANAKMLTADYQNGTLCLACHNKLQWATNPSVHQTATSTWNAVGQNPWKEDMGAAGFADDTPALQGCLSCHQMHGASINKHLKRGVVPGAETGTAYEEWNCLNCHSGNMTNALNINAVLAYTNKHGLGAKGYANLHVPNRSSAGVPTRETAANLQANRHVECVDCHNPHGAMAGNATGTVKGNHTTVALTGSYQFGPNLLGSWGVKPTGGWGAAPAVGNYTTYAAWTEVDFQLPLTGVDNLEGYMCLKCHSSYSYPATPPTVPSAIWAKEWDVASAMNPMNQSHHAVFGAGANAPLAAANPNWPANGLGLTNNFTYGYWVQNALQYETGAALATAPVGLWNIRHTSTITCTDCHASSSLADARGPHGSNNPWMLRGNEAFGTVYGGATSPKNFCYNCHRRDVYGDEDVVSVTTGAGLKPGLYARVVHPVVGRRNCPNTNSAQCAAFYQAPNALNTTGGLLTGNASNTYGILCMSCHGGSQVTIGANTFIHGIHGSNTGVGAAGTANLGARLLNGACNAGYTKATTVIRTSIWFKGAGTPGTAAPDNVCTFDFSPANCAGCATGEKAQYNY